MNLITRHGRALLLAAAFAFGAIFLFGCGDDGSNPDSNDVGGITPGTTPGGGGSYESVVLGGKTWMKKNLNVSVTDSWCYDNSSDSCAKYGRLYTWQAAKSACQSIGWRLPDTADWRRLVEAAGGIYVAGKHLKSRTGWAAYSGVENLDTYGFSALPGGGQDYTEGSFGYAGFVGFWWTATECTDGLCRSLGDGACSGGMAYDHDDVGYCGVQYQSNALSARCVKDN
jgi:uncharacterized protein (TIGR02145 family)